MHVNNINLPLVVHVIDRLPADGAERLMVDVLKNRSKRFCFAVLCLVEGGALEAELKELKIPVYIFRKKHKYDISILFKLIVWFRQNRPVVVHTHLFTADTWGRLAAYIARVPCIVNTVHSTNTWKGSLHRVVDFIMSYVSNKLIACSDEVEVVLVNIFKIKRKKIRIISNGIDFRRFESIKLTTIDVIDKIPEAIVKIVIIGRLHPAKGHLDLIDAITIMMKETNKFHVFMVGEGDLQQEIITKCNENNLSEHITLLGQRSDIPVILAKCDIFVMPSHWEGLPMALLEAMAMRKAIIATRVGGIPDVIQNQVNGLLINKSDIQALADNIMQLIIDKKLRLQLGTAAKQSALEKYSAKNVSVKYEALYLNILGDMS